MSVTQAIGDRISVVIPAFNSERFIEEAIRSVLAQTQQCFECIVVDDGSSDQTNEIAQSFDAIRYVWKENGGDASARNRGVEEAEGDFVAFLDADDIWRADKLEKQMELFGKEPALGLVYSGIEVVTEDLRPVTVLFPASSQDALRNTLLVEKPYITGVGSTAIVPVEVVRKTPFDTRLAASADWAFACQVAMKYPVAAVDEPLALYRQHAGAQVHRNLRAVERDMHLVWSELFAEEGFPEELRRHRKRAMANLDLSLAYSSYRQGSHGRAWKYLGRALLRRPDRVAAAFWRRYMGEPDRQED